MKTVRRRAIDPELRWRSAGYDQQYRVSVRNENTGDRRTIYEGFRQSCRLPADFRLSPDQLTFIVANRPSGTQIGGYVRWQEFTRIPRIGDDLDPEAADVMIGAKVPGASVYRFKVRDVLSQDQLVDYCDTTPRFLLPAGRIANMDTEWSVWARAHGVWHKADYHPVSKVAIEAAQQRAKRLIEIEDEVRPRRAVVARRSVLTAPDLPPAPGARTSLALAIPATLMPLISPSPDPAGVIATQWSDGAGGGAVERTAAMLERQGQSGWFFVDVEMGLAIDPDALKTLVARLLKGGHPVGLYLGVGALAPAKATPAERLARMLATLKPMTGSAVPGVMLGEGAKRSEWLDALTEVGLAGVIASRGALRTLDDAFHWRTAPFLAGPRTVVFPGTTFLSTPAHARDRVTRHTLGNRDALAAGSAEAAVAALAATEGSRLIIAEIDPLLLLKRRMVRDRGEADIWNSLVLKNQPTWFKAGWKRSAKGFEIAEGSSEIQRELLTGMLANLDRSSVPWADWDAVFSPERVGGWLAAAPTEALVEQRRGPRAFRPSVIRRYDDVYRLSLLAS